MRCRAALLLIGLQCMAFAVIIDQVAIVVGNSIIKDSDIRRDIRVTDFLNRRPVNLSEAARKQAASRLIDQVFIRREIMLGGYTRATLEEADQQLNRLKEQRYRTDAAFEAALQHYGLTSLELRTEFQWQLTVLHFIDERFKPAVLVSDTDITKYYREHEAALHEKYPGKSLDELREEIRNILTGERVNQQFFSWLDEQRKDTKIRYLEASLQ